MPSPSSSAPFGANVLLTGANRGIGLGMVKEILKAGGVANLFAGCRKPSEAKVPKHLAIFGVIFHFIYFGGIEKRAATLVLGIASHY